MKKIIIILLIFVLFFVQTGCVTVPKNQLEKNLQHKKVDNFELVTKIATASILIGALGGALGAAGAYFHHWDSTTSIIIGTAIGTLAGGIGTYYGTMGQYEPPTEHELKLIKKKERLKTADTFDQYFKKTMVDFRLIDKYHERYTTSSVTGFISGLALGALGWSLFYFGENGSKSGSAWAMGGGIFGGMILGSRLSIWMWDEANKEDAAKIQQFEKDLNTKFSSGEVKTDIEGRRSVAYIMYGPILLLSILAIYILAAPEPGG